VAEWLASLTRDREVASSSLAFAQNVHYDAALMQLSSLVAYITASPGGVAFEVRRWSRPKTTLSNVHCGQYLHGCRLENTSTAERVNGLSTTAHHSGWLRHAEDNRSSDVTARSALSQRMNVLAQRVKGIHTECWP
jgi:hypothetical protein